MSKNPLAARDESTRFVREAHRLCRDLDEPDPARYWVDFLASILTSYIALWVYLRAEELSLLQAAALVLCALTLYRSVVFTHEIAHQRRGAFRAFTFGWNVLCGIPTLMPSFLYGDHKGHHANHAYGTWADPEYLLRTGKWRVRILCFLLLPVAYPLMAAARFLILTPLALVSQRLDRFVWMYASSLYVMNELYRRDYDSPALARSRWVQELICSAWAWAVVVLVVLGRISGSMLWKVYLVFLFWLAINQVRTLVAHRYTNGTDAPMSYLDQVLDTNTFDRGRWLPHLWAPLGLRYHALHHLVPSLPYHAMAKAHRRLLARLPPGSAYHRTLKPGLWPVLAAIARDRELQRPR